MSCVETVRFVGRGFEFDRYMSDGVSVPDVADLLFEGFEFCMFRVVRCDDMQCHDMRKPIERPDMEIVNRDHIR